MLRLKRFLPFTSVTSALWFAFRHRRPIWDWGSWIVRSVPRVVNGQRDDVVAEARLRFRLAVDNRLLGDRINVEVEDGRALLSGEVASGHRQVATSLADGAPGVQRVSDVLRERTRGRPVPA